MINWFILTPESNVIGIVLRNEAFKARSPPIGGDRWNVAPLDLKIDVDILYAINDDIESKCQRIIRLHASLTCFMHL